MATAPTSTVTDRRRELVALAVFVAVAAGLLALRRMTAAAAALIGP